MFVVRVPQWELARLLEVGSDIIKWLGTISLCSTVATMVLLSTKVAEMKLS